MPRLLGVDIPNKKKIEYALRYVYGVGPAASRVILEKAEIDENRRASDLSEEELNKIANSVVDLGYKVEGDLRREVVSNIKRLQATKSYRGFRHMRNLPARGQRTKTNARTRKGPKKFVGVIKGKK